ncbi:MAG: hypothetical protein VXV96_15615 [Bdellovibrionota bacterium]|nr:hypothetical protein [Bdellovibrionota bacterium]
MKNFIITLLFVVSPFIEATNLNTTYLKELKEIKTVSGKGDNKLFKLITDSAQELSVDWSPELAQELARVFNSLLEVNQNSFLVELLSPVLETRAKKFRPILYKTLSKKNKKAYEAMKKRNQEESKRGNG